MVIHELHKIYLFEFNFNFTILLDFPKYTLVEFIQVNDQNKVLFFAHS